MKARIVVEAALLIAASGLVVAFAVVAAWVMFRDVPRKQVDAADDGGAVLLVLPVQRPSHQADVEIRDNGRCVMAYNITDDGGVRIVECGR